MATGARLETNIQRVKKSVVDTQGRYALRTRSLARKIGAATRDSVRANIKPRNQDGVFPGYAMTGTLEKKAVASEPQKRGKNWTVTVRMQLTGKAKRYALIHETGGRIPIRNPAQVRAMFANLRKHGQKVGRGSGKPLRAIRIKRKSYFARGIEKARREYSTRRLKNEF